MLNDYEFMSIYDLIVISINYKLLVNLQSSINDMNTQKHAQKECSL
jgi:hypothetical protein